MIWINKIIVIMIVLTDFWVAHQLHKYEIEVHIHPDRYRYDDFSDQALGMEQS